MTPTTAPTRIPHPRHLAAVPDAPPPGVRPERTFYWLGRCPDTPEPDGVIGISRSGHYGDFLSRARMGCPLGCGATHEIAEVPEDVWIVAMGPQLDREIAEVLDDDDTV